MGERRHNDRESDADTVEHDSFLRAVARSPQVSPPPDAKEESRTRQDLIGRTLLHFHVTEVLGAGGMGVVYKAVDQKLLRPVALKVLSPRRAADGRYKETLLREARSAAAVSHPNIAAIHEVHDGPEGSFFVMELVQGETLRARLSRTGPLRPEEALRVSHAIARGLARAHASGVVHRDLKCENVMQMPDGHIKLLDFGLATMLGLDEDRAGRGVAGTRATMSPEQARGERVDARADVYGLGVILSELLSGVTPFARGGGEPSQWGDACSPAWTPTPPLRLVAPGVPVALAELVERCLAYDPAERPADGAALVTELERCMTAGPGKRPVWRARRTVLVAAGIVGAAYGVVRVEAALSHRRALASPPPAGMALIDVGSTTVGRSRVEVQAQCAEIGPTCDAERLARLSWQIPETRITVPPFYLDVHEVTNQEMAEVLNSLRAVLTVAEDDDYHFRRYVRYNTGLGHDGELLVDLYPALGGIEYVGPSAQDGYRVRPGRASWPASQVSWFGARLYCATRGRRLPTEQEWEAAARGSANRTFPWGGSPLRCGAVAVPSDGLAPFDSTCPTPETPSDVMTAAQDVTPERIHDLAGNVNEWTDTLFGAGDAGPGAQDALRVTRGGSYASSLMTRTSVRSRQPPNSVAPNTGFRCAQSVAL